MKFQGFGRSQSHATSVTVALIEVARDWFFQNPAISLAKKICSIRSDRTNLLNQSNCRLWERANRALPLSQLLWQKSRAIGPFKTLQSHWLRRFVLSDRIEQIFKTNEIAAFWEDQSRATPVLLWQRWHAIGPFKILRSHWLRRFGKSDRSDRTNLLSQWNYRVLERTNQVQAACLPVWVRAGDNDVTTLRYQTLRSEIWGQLFISGIWGFKFEPRILRARDVTDFRE